MVEGKSMEAGLYLIRKGKIRIYNKSKIRDDTMGEGGYFGEEQLMADVKRKSNGPDDPTSCRAEFTVEVLEDCVCGILWLAVLRNCLDTTMLGQPQASVLDSLITRHIPMKELKKHTILGEWIRSVDELIRELVVRLSFDLKHDRKRNLRASMVGKLRVIVACLRQMQ
jgi:hypothetical protein